MMNDNNSQNTDSRSYFALFWDILVQPIIKKVYSEVDQDFKVACDFDYAYSNQDEYKKNLHEFYRDKREWLKTVYMPHEDSPKLDMHKLGAVLCRSLLNYKPFYLDYAKAEQYVVNRFNSADPSGNADWFFSNIYASYKVAFYASIGTSYLNLLYRCKKNGDAPAYDFFNAQQCLSTYYKSKTHEDFDNSCMLALQKNDILCRDFDYLGYAILLYQLEQFNYPTSGEKPE